MSESALTEQMNHPSDRQKILLLADDGRMKNLLTHRLTSSSVTVQKNAFGGIFRLGQEDYDLVLMRAEGLGRRLNEAVSALKRVRPAAKIVLYSEAASEVDCRSALDFGAWDYLIWPVPASEIHEILSAKVPEKTDFGPKKLFFSRKSAKKTVFEPIFNVKHWHELSESIPLGRSVVVEQAQRILTRTLNLQWVKIHTEEDSEPEVSGRTINLSGKLGDVGTLILGPAITSMEPDEDTIQEVAGYISTLLYLVRRDETLKHLATVDSLTGAHNRRYLDYFIHQIIQRNADKHMEMALLLFDIDDFKYYNDTYGHGAGDEVLRESYKLMRQCCREHDVVVRIGGDEFAVLFWDTQPRSHYDPDQRRNNEHEEHVSLREQIETPERTHSELVMFLCNRFRRKMMTNEFPALGSEARGVLSISGGVACYPADGKTFTELLAKADEGLLAAKRQGKNQIFLIGQQ